MLKYQSRLKTYHSANTLVEYGVSQGCIGDTADALEAIEGAVSRDDTIIDLALENGVYDNNIPQDFQRGCDTVSNLYSVTEVTDMEAEVNNTPGMENSSVLERNTEACECTREGTIERGVFADESDVMGAPTAQEVADMNRANKSLVHLKELTGAKRG